MENRKGLNIRVHKLLDQREYESTLLLLEQTLEEFKSSNSSDYSLLTELTGCFISLGVEANMKEAINQGLSLLAEYKTSLLTVASEASLNYFLGNAKHGLYRVYLKENPPYKLPTPEVSRTYLFESKSAFFRAYKTLKLNKLDRFSLMVLTNLANELDSCGRIVEALQLYDTVLRKSINHPQALVSKAEALVNMVRTTKFHKSVSFFSTIYSLYEEGEKYLVPTSEVQESIRRGKAATLEILLATEFDIKNLGAEYILNESEFKAHTATVRFNLTNFLSLSEHGLFCKCNAARVDDLMIGFFGLKTTDKKLMRLEILNNRIKSEFSLSRQLYYDHLKKKNEDNVYYPDMLDSAKYGMKLEKLRSSFRMCFGILDKIAEGLVYLFDLPTEKRGKIYFEQFWGDNGKPKGRWERLNLLDNIHLTALYSIASDLSKEGGEFAFYKKWRNKLEHGVFSLRGGTQDSYQLLDDDLCSTFTGEKEFKEKTLHILQVTRAAIFSFVYCCREELVSEGE